MCFRCVFRFAPLHAPVHSVTALAGWDAGRLAFLASCDLRVAGLGGAAPAHRERDR